MKAVVQSMRSRFVMLILGIVIGIFANNYTMSPRIVEAKEKADRWTLKGWLLATHSYHRDRKRSHNYSLESYRQAVMLHEEAIKKRYPDETVYHYGIRVCDEARQLTWMYCEGE